MACGRVSAAGASGSSSADVARRVPAPRAVPSNGTTPRHHAPTGLPLATATSPRSAPAERLHDLPPSLQAVLARPPRKDQHEALKATLRQPPRTQPMASRFDGRAAPHAAELLQPYVSTAAGFETLVTRLTNLMAADAAEAERSLSA